MNTNGIELFERSVSLFNAVVALQQAVACTVVDSPLREAVLQYEELLVSLLNETHAEIIGSAE